MKTDHSENLDSTENGILIFESDSETTNNFSKTELKEEKMSVPFKREDLKETGNLSDLNMENDLDHNVTGTKKTAMPCKMCTFHAETLSLHKNGIHGIVDDPNCAQPDVPSKKIPTIPIQCYRCHVCQFLTFKHDNLVNHLNNLHGLIAATPKDDMDIKKEFIEICEYKSSAFVGDSLDFYSSSVKDEPIDSTESDVNSENEGFCDVKNDVQCDVSFDDDFDPYFCEDSPPNKKRTNGSKDSQFKRPTPILPDIVEILQIQPDTSGNETASKYKCPECEYIGVNEHNVRRHFGKMHVLKKEVYECEECEYKTPKRQDFNVHVRAVHQNIRDFRCSYCPYAAAKRSQLKRHIGRMHNKDSDITEDSKLDHGKIKSGKNARTKKNKKTIKHNGSTLDYRKRPSFSLPLPQEMLKSLTKSEDKYNCEYCGFESEYKNQMKEHLSQFHYTKSKEFSCKLCNFVGEDLISYRNHMKDNHLTEFKNHMCDSCAYRTNSPYRLEAHIKMVHLKVKEYVCEFCNYATIEKVKLQRHYGNDHPEKVDYLPIQTIVVYTNHSGVEKHKCNHEGCEFICQFSHVLHEHKLEVHKEVAEFARCGTCNYSAISKEEMSNHLGTVHDSMRIFACKKCDFSGATEDELNEHSGGHTSLQENDDFKIRKLQHAFIQPFMNIPMRRMYKCNICDYAHLERHIVVKHKKSVHEKVKERMCDFCSYRTFKLTNLSRHIKAKHSGVKDFLCHLCNFRSALQWNLTVHMRCHERQGEDGSKPRRRAKRVTILPNHIDIVDGLMQCPQCQLGFQNRIQLHRHYKKHMMPEMMETAISPKSEISESTQDSIPMAFNHSVFQSSIPDFAAQYFHQHNQPHPQSHH